METRFREPTRGDYVAATLRIGAYVVGITLGAIVLVWQFDLPGFLLWIVLTVLATVVLIRWHTRNFGYRCPNCDHVFTITAWTNATSLNLGDRKSLRCPNCGKHSACKIMVREDRLPA